MEDRAIHMDSGQPLTEPNVSDQCTRRSRSPAEALLNRLKSSRSLSRRRTHTDPGSPDASDNSGSPTIQIVKSAVTKSQDRGRNASSSEEEDQKRGSKHKVFRLMRRQFRNRLLRSRQKKSSEKGTTDLAVADWLGQTNEVFEAPISSALAGEESVNLLAPKPVTDIEIELDADAEYEDDDETHSSVAPLVGRRKGVNKFTLPDHIRKNLLLEVTIHLISGSHLVVRDSCGTSDPYVKFKYNGKILERSKIVRKALNPIWDEYFCFYMDDLQKPLELRVYDYDTLLDDYMGRAMIDLSALSLDENAELTLELEDETGKSKEKFMGTLRLSCRIKMAQIDCETASSLSTARVNLNPYRAKIKCNTTDVEVPMPSSKKAGFMLRGLRSAMDVSKRFKATNWIATVTITLIEGIDLLAMDDNGLSDPFVKFKLGNEKYRSKVIRTTLSPRWLEQFDLRLGYEDSDVLEMTVWDHDDIGRNDFMGRASISLANLPHEETHFIEKALEDGAGVLRLLVTISGSFEPDSVTDLRNYTVSEVDRQEILSKFNFMQSFTNMNEIGWLQVKVLKAEGLHSVAWSGKIDAYAVVSLINSRLQTHTVYRSGEPEWNKVFVFHIHDIHSVLDISVFDEEKEKSEILGRVAIPILRIRNGEKRWYALKDRKLLHRGKGAILLEMDFIYNYVKAVLCTLRPKEEKYTRIVPKFKVSLFRSRINRLSRIIESCVVFGQFVESCFAWESPARSITAFGCYVVAVWTFEIYMLPLSLVIIFVKEYVRGQYIAFLSRRNRPEENRKQDEVANSSPTVKEAGEAFNNSCRRTNSSEEKVTKIKYDKKSFFRRSRHPSPWCCTSRKTARSVSSVGVIEPETTTLQENVYPTSTDDEDKSDKDDKRAAVNIKDRIQTVQDTMLKVQEIMGSISTFIERVHNTFTWTVPWLSILGMLGLITVTFVLYCVPLRWLALAWGINKFSKKLLRPHSVENNEVFDFFSRAPSDVQLGQYKELKLDNNSSAATEKRR